MILKSSAHFNLLRTAQKIRKESVEAQLADTVALMQNAQEDQEAQHDIDELIVILNGRDRAVNRLQDAINYCLSYGYDEDDDDNDGGATGVITKPKTTDSTGR
jgi:hypothetical protein